jgi:hypothetical protein
MLQNSTPFPHFPQDDNDWSAIEVVRQQPARQNSLVQSWYDLTAMPEAPANASFYKRESARKSRLLSTILFYYTIVVIVFLPCCLLLPNPQIVWADAGAIVAAILALILNRQRKTLLAAILTVVTFQLVLVSAIFLLTPFDESSIQIYDLLIMTDLLAVSLLPARNVFIFAFVNSLIILASLLIQKHTPTFDADLHAQFIPIMIRPIALQFIVAGVSYVWTHSTTKAIIRADRAEMVASLEHALNEQKRDLDDGIEQILQTHVAVANGNLNARAPLNQDNALWQISRALNTLLVRLQRAVQAERELQRVQQAVNASVQAIQNAEKLQQLPRVPFTQTAIDPLIAALQGKTIAYTQVPYLTNNIPGTPSIEEQSPSGFKARVFPQNASTHTPHR